MLKQALDECLRVITAVPRQTAVRTSKRILHGEDLWFRTALRYSVSTITKEEN